MVSGRAAREAGEWRRGLTPHVHFQDGRPGVLPGRWPGCVQAAWSWSPGSPLSQRDTRTCLPVDPPCQQSSSPPPEQLQWGPLGPTLIAQRPTGTSLGVRFLIDEPLPSQAADQRSRCGAGSGSALCPRRWSSRRHQLLGTHLLTIIY